jgi:glycosyltransferase involved in cell wall biosynthesis
MKCQIASAEPRIKRLCNFGGYPLLQPSTFPWRRREVVVVDDGSSDNTAEVAYGFPGVRYIWQENQAFQRAEYRLARERRRSRGFLDADDFLLRGALEAGANCLMANPEWAFVSADYQYVNSDGTVLAKVAQPFIEHDHYRALLQDNYIGMHATVMYRRQTLEGTGGFETTLPACEDYDLYLRIARKASDWLPPRRRSSVPPTR